ncbi:MAG TPA: 16S rRNA (cytosine(1402)-N(4))-methyltransferase RsmH [Blastocatellia bacterium]|nr:16S rRNA (cytosine(1402)-N(4))-methyltransferase RsmH [Blastocatellia bacterium]
MSLHSPQALHQPVMLNESLAALGALADVSAEKLFIDATLGMGGHSAGILQASPHNRVIGLDRDAEAIAQAEQRMAEFGARFTAIHTDYRQIKPALLEKGISAVNGIIADLGISSFQLDTPERGFSFRFADDAPLDMRMDRTEPTTAADLVNSLSERELADLIFAYGEERASRRIAHRIVQARTKTPLRTTKQLADLVVAAIHQKGHWKIHPATKTFQALRIAVNRELDGLEQFVADAVDLLTVDGRLVVITFHSLEDRLIKQALKFQSGHCVCPPQLPDCRCGTVRRVELLTNKPTQPRESETLANPRARSAKLRACRKL